MTANQTIDDLKLLPCPFCGSAGNFVRNDYVDMYLQPLPVVECINQDCGAWVPAGSWNRRLKLKDPSHLNCQSCGTHEVSLDVCCHNSGCENYAEEITIYKGWEIDNEKPND